MRPSNQRRTLAAICLIAVVLHANPPPALAATIYWDGTGTSWNLVGPWSISSSSSLALFDPPAPPGPSDLAVFNITTVNTPQTVNLNAAQAALGLGFAFAPVFAAFGFAAAVVRGARLALRRSGRVRGRLLRTSRSPSAIYTSFLKREFGRVEAFQGFRNLKRTGTLDVVENWSRSPVPSTKSLTTQSKAPTIGYIHLCPEQPKSTASMALMSSTESNTPVPGVGTRSRNGRTCQ